jgi:hypothetical protein
VPSVTGWSAVLLTSAVQPAVDCGDIECDAGQVSSQQPDGIERSEYGDVLQVAVAAGTNFRPPEALLSFAVKMRQLPVIRLSAFGTA